MKMYAIQNERICISGAVYDQSIDSSQPNRH
jgi:hypothetical protein